MSDRPFVHLHCHSHYSLLDGASKIPALVKRAKALGMPALAITDHGNLYGAVEFLREAKAADLKPIVGLEAYVAPGRRTDRSTGGGSGQEYAFHLTLLARDGEGVRNLMRLSSASFLEGFYYKPRIDKEILQRHSEGLICLSGCASAEFSDNILHDKTAEAERLCAWYQKVFGEENFYVEIQDNGIQIQRDCAAGALDIARRMGLPVVATSDAHYLTRDDAPAHDVLLCINTGKTVDDPNRMRFENDQFHVRSPEEMYAAMPGHEEALATSVRIAERVEDHYKSLDLGKRQFPSFQPPDQKTPEEYLRELCEEGLRQRYGDDPSPEVRAARPRAGHHQPDGVRLLLPDRLGLRPLRPRARHPELGARLGLRGAGQLPAPPQPRRPAQVRPAVRAVPRPEPLRGAGYRHRPVQGAALRGHRLRPAEVRRGQRGADRHLRHDGGQGRDQGRRPGAEHPAGPGRSGHQADPDPAQHHDRGRAEGRARADADGRRRPRDRAAARLRAAARRDRAERRHARRRRRDRRPPALRPRPAATAAEQGQGEGGRQHPVGDGRRREGRPAEDGLPRPPQPDEPGRGRQARRAAAGARRSTCSTSRSTTRPPTSSSSAATRRGSSSSTARASATCWSR